MQTTQTTSPIFEIQQRTGYVLLRFFGFIDASIVEQIKPSLIEKIPSTCGNIVIDLQRVDFLDSHGVGLFVSLLKRAHKNGGRICFAAADGQPASVLNMVGFNSHLVTYCKDTNEADALLNSTRKTASTV